MTYPIPKRFIGYVADKSRCSVVPDVEIESALEWLREQIVKERDRLDWLYEQQEAAAMSDDD